MNFRSYEESTYIENEMRRKEQHLHGNRKPLRNFKDFYFPPNESPHLMPYPDVPYSDERFAYPRHLQFHPYYNHERFPFTKRLPVPPSYQSHFHELFNSQRDRFTKEDPAYLKNAYSGYSNELNRRDNIKAETFPFKDDFFKPIDKLEENVEEAESSIVNYCLDRDTQHTISRLQNDFRLTKKYRTFVMCEVPLIEDFKPTPATTAYKFHNRYKCLFQQFLDSHDLDVDFDSEPKKMTEEEDVTKNVTEAIK